VEELLGRLRSQGKTAHDASKDSSVHAPRRLQVLCMHHLPFDTFTSTRATFYEYLRASALARRKR